MASITVSPASASETTALRTVTVTLDIAAPAGGLNVGWQAEGNGSPALSAADFAGGVFPSGAVAIAAGQLSGTASLAIADDALLEGTEGGLIRLLPGAGYALGAATAAFQVVDDEAAPAVVTAPVVTTAQAGQPAAGSDGAASGNPAPTATREWLLDGVSQGPAFTPAAGDAGKQLALRVTWSNGLGTPAVATSAAVAVAAGAASLAIPDVPPTDYRLMLIGPSTMAGNNAGGASDSANNFQAAVSGSIQWRVMRNVATLQRTQMLPRAVAGISTGQTGWRIANNVGALFSADARSGDFIYQIQGPNDNVTPAGYTAATLLGEIGQIGPMADYSEGSVGGVPTNYQAPATYLGRLEWIRSNFTASARLRDVAYTSLMEWDSTLDLVALRHATLATIAEARPQRAVNMGLVARDRVLFPSPADPGYVDTDDDDKRVLGMTPTTYLRANTIDANGEPVAIANGTPDLAHLNGFGQRRVEQVIFEPARRAQRNQAPFVAPCQVVLISGSSALQSGGFCAAVTPFGAVNGATVQWVNPSTGLADGYSHPEFDVGFVGSDLVFTRKPARAGLPLDGAGYKVYVRVLVGPFAYTTSLWLAVEWALTAAGIANQFARVQFGVGAPFGSGLRGIRGQQHGGFDVQNGPRMALFAVIEPLVNPGTGATSGHGVQQRVLHAFSTTGGVGLFMNASSDGATGTGRANLTQANTAGATIHASAAFSTASGELRLGRETALFADTVTVSGVARTLTMTTDSIARGAVTTTVTAPDSTLGLNSPHAFWSFANGATPNTLRSAIKCLALFVQPPGFSWDENLGGQTNRQRAMNAANWSNDGTISLAVAGVLAPIRAYYFDGKLSASERLWMGKNAGSGGWSAARGRIFTHVPDGQMAQG